jgi:DNA-binding XRE family transcriptional regulator
MSDAEARVADPRRKVRTDETAFRAAFAAAGCNTGAERAALLDMQRRSVYRYISGEIEPGLTTARQIAARLGADLDQLWPVPSASEHQIAA